MSVAGVNFGIGSINKSINLWNYINIATQPPIRFPPQKHTVIMDSSKTHAIVVSKWANIFKLYISTIIFKAKTKFYDTWTILQCERFTTDDHVHTL